MGIAISSNFDLGSGLPLDSRVVKADVTARDAIPDVQRFVGLVVYVISTLTNYQLQGGITNGDWLPITGPGVSNFTFQYSLEESSGGIVTLVGDESSPGLNYYYGTDITGVKGWYALPEIDSDLLNNYTFQYSIIEDSSAQVQLVGDTASPGNSMLYGTNGSGIRGWYSQTSLSGYVTSSGTPVANQLAVWVDPNTITGVSNVTYDGTTFRLDHLGEYTTNHGIELHTQGQAYSRWSNASWFHYPVAAPAAPTATILNGTLGTYNYYYSYRIRFIDSFGLQTDVGSQSNIVYLPAPTNRIRLDNIPTGPSEIVARRIYRGWSSTSPPTRWSLIHELLDNTTTTWNDTIPDWSMPDASTSAGNIAGAVYLNDQLMQTISESCISYGMDIPRNAASAIYIGNHIMPSGTFNDNDYNETTVSHIMIGGNIFNNAATYYANNNIVLGFGVLPVSAVYPYSNIAIGSEIMSLSTSSSGFHGNIAIGRSILHVYNPQNTFSYSTNSVLLGSSILYTGSPTSIQSSTANVIIGSTAASEGGNIGYSVIIGNGAGQGWTSYQFSRNYDLFIGYNTGTYSNGSYNVYVGNYSGNPTSPDPANTGSYNTALGHASLRLISTGSYNTAVGYQTGDLLTTGSYNVYIGYNVDALGTDTNNEVVIGSQAIGHGTNTVTIGNTSITGNYFTGILYGADFALSSDEKLKTNIKPYEPKALDVEYKSFEFINVPGVTRYGVIAQEVQKKYPELVREGSDGMLSVSSIDLLFREVAYLRKKIRDLQDVFDCE